MGTDSTDGKSLFAFLFSTFVLFTGVQPWSGHGGHSGIMSIFFPGIFFTVIAVFIYTEYFILFMELHFRCPASD